MGSSPIRTILFFGFGSSEEQHSFICPERNKCLIRLAVRTPRCGRGNPGSNPGLDIFVYTRIFVLEWFEPNKKRLYLYPN